MCHLQLRVQAHTGTLHRLPCLWWSTSNSYPSMKPTVAYLKIIFKKCFTPVIFPLYFVKVQIINNFFIAFLPWDHQPFASTSDVFYGASLADCGYVSRWWAHSRCGNQESSIRNTQLYSCQRSSEQTNNSEKDVFPQLFSKQLVSKKRIKNKDYDELKN